MPLTLHGYWRSGAAWRVRIALALKGVAYAQVTHDLRTGAQKDPGFLMLNPQGLVPALDIGEAVLIQSLAILEWLDERYPEPSLLPSGLSERAQVRVLAASGIRANMAVRKRALRRERMPSRASTSYQSRRFQMRSIWNQEVVRGATDTTSMRKQRLCQLFGKTRPSPKRRGSQPPSTTGDGRCYSLRHPSA